LKIPDEMAVIMHSHLVGDLLYAQVRRHKKLLGLFEAARPDVPAGAGTGLLPKQIVKPRHGQARLIGQFRRPACATDISFDRPQDGFDPVIHVTLLLLSQPRITERGNFLK
jgi:hypothetical protein